MLHIYVYFMKALSPSSVIHTAYKMLCNSSTNKLEKFLFY